MPPTSNPTPAAVFDHLTGVMEAEGFRGYDPYDILLSPFPFRLFGTYAAAVATQLHKRNPLNVRRLLGIPKTENPKALGLLLWAYSRMQSLRPDRDYSRQFQQLRESLLKLVSKGYHGACWGYPFPWASPGKYLPAFAPNGVVTAFAVKGLHAYYLLTKDSSARELLLSAVDFVTHDLPAFEDATGRCISYTPFRNDICYNASLLSAEVLARAYSITGDAVLRENALAAARFVVARQHPDGRWNYSKDLKTGVEREQIDFHQGFVIDSLEHIQQFTGTRLQAGEEAIRKGLDFYRTRQFRPDGRSLWRYPKEYPVDIHHQAQGIITFARHDPAFARTILDWTLKNLYDYQKGTYYYRKYSFFTDRTSHIRWGNAWMAVALAELVDRG
jgi:hypothetical protein